MLLTRTKLPDDAPAMDVAREAAEFLRGHGATRVLLFGSLARGNYDPKSSDIDIYFEGIPRPDVDSVAGRGMCHFPKHDIDFWAEVRCPARFLARILETGIPI